MKIVNSNFIYWIALLLFILVLPPTYAILWQHGNTSPQVKFSHKLHADNGAECDACHVSIAKSNRSQDNNLPEKTCQTCHDESDFSGNPPKIVYDRKLVKVTTIQYGLKFSHQKHLNRGLKCEKCHIHIKESASVTDNNLPSMTVCSECHKPQTGKCNYCHITLGSDRYVPASHNKTLWIAWHKNQAERDKESCSDCHKGDIRVHLSQNAMPGPGHNLNGDAKECSSCHKGDIRTEQHGNSYILTHGVDTKVNSNRCVVCHKRSECIDCHKSSDIKMTIHPANWANGGHSSAARNNLGSCVSCHDENRCLSCHSGISPHPKNWRSQLAFSFARQHRNSTVCMKCHEREELCTKCHSLRD